MKVKYVVELTVESDVHWTKKWIREAIQGALEHPTATSKFETDGITKIRIRKIDKD